MTAILFGSVGTLLKILPHSHMRVLDRFIGTRKFQARNLKAKSGRVSGLKVCLRGGMPKITLGITELPEIWGWDYGIEEP